MLLKSKISFTILAIYEMVAISVLHFQRICDAMFPTPFCDSWYRYFLFCVIVPLIGFLIWMWLHEIFVHRRRRRFIRRAKNTVRGVVSSIRDQVSSHIDMDDLEKIITAAVLVGIKRYADNHPKIRENINHIMDVTDGRAELDLMELSSQPVASRSSMRTVVGRSGKASRMRR